MVPKTGPRATTRAVHKGIFCEQVLHGMVICGRRASAAWSRFRDQNLVLKMGPEICPRARENGYWRFKFPALGACDFVRLRGHLSPALCRPTPDPNPSCTRSRAARGAAKQWGAALAWLARRARRHAPRDHEQCRFSALPPCSCPAQRSYFEDRFRCPLIVKLFS